MAKRTTKSGGEEFIETWSYSDPLTGKTKRKYFYAPKQRDARQAKRDFQELISRQRAELNKTDAEREAEELESQRKSDLSKTFLDCWVIWYDTYKTGVSFNSRAKYATLKAHLEPIMQRKVWLIKQLDIVQILNTMAEKGLSVATIRETKSIIIQILDVAEDNGFVNGNVARRVKMPVNAKPKVERSCIKPETERLILQLAAADELHRMAIPALLMLFCGLRRGEVVALHWTDIDLTNFEVQISKSAAFGYEDGENRNTNVSIEKAPKTAAGIRTVPIPQLIVPLLTEARRRAESVFVLTAVKDKASMISKTAFRRSWDSYMHALNLAAGGSDPVKVKDDEGKPVQRTFTPAVIAAEEFTAHQLRHTYATLAHDAEVDIKLRKLWLGHAEDKNNVTESVYTHITPEATAKSVAKLNEFFNARYGAKNSSCGGTVVKMLS